MESCLFDTKDFLYYFIIVFLKVSRTLLLLLLELFSWRSYFQLGISRYFLYILDKCDMFFAKHINAFIKTKKV